MSEVDQVWKTVLRDARGNVLKAAAAVERAVKNYRGPKAEKDFLKRVLKKAYREAGKLM